MQKFPLGQLVKIKTGKLDANAKLDGGQYPFFTCSKEISRIDSYTYDCECVLVAGNGDLNVKYYNGKFDAYQRTYIIEDNKTQELDIKYLYYFMQSYIDKLRSQTIGGVIQYIKLNNLTDIDFPLPPLSHQKQIIQKLDTLTNLINLRKLSIDKTEKLTKSIFIEMFGDPMINKKGWEVKKLDELCNKITDGTHKTPKYQNSGVVFLSAKNISSYELNLNDIKYLSQEEHNQLIKRSKPEKGDILLAKSGTIGIAVRININLEFSIFESLALLKLKELANGNYLTFLLNSDFAKNQYLSNTKGNSIKHLHLIDIKNLKIPFPPISLQNKFASIVEKNEENIKKQKVSLKKLEELYSGVMQESFRI